MNLTVNHYGPEYYEEHRDAGLDYLGHGEWQENYAKWMVESLGLKPGMKMLDVGCACGSILEGFRKQGLECVGIDLSEHMIKLGREKFPGLRLEIMDAVNMHLFKIGEFDFVHSAQVAEHWNPDLVPFILYEISRVMNLESRFFCCMDTLDFFMRHNRNPTGAGEDPTHQCLKPLFWWKAVAHDQFLFSAPMDDLKAHELSYFNQYDWDALLLQTI